MVVFWQRNYMRINDYYNQSYMSIYDSNLFLIQSSHSLNGLPDFIHS